jgi:hypothetical protein
MDVVALFIKRNESLFRGVSSVKLQTRWGFSSLFFFKKIKGWTTSQVTGGAGCGWPIQGNVTKNLHTELSHSIC